MIRRIVADGYKCDVVENPVSDKVTYMIYPDGNIFDQQWLESKVSDTAASIVVVYVPLDRWNDDLTPWPEPGESKGARPFGGEAPQFLATLTGKIMPECEKDLTVRSRDLVGVSLAGLFTLWQWLRNSTFESIACLSGSFWYEGFIKWFDAQELPAKTGKAYFLLGTDEPKARTVAFRSVGVNTEQIVSRLRQAGIATRFDWVPGNHFTDPIGRAERALAYLS